MKKMIALALLALGVASLVGCRHHHHRPDHDHPDYRRDNRAVPPPPPPKPGPRPRSHRP